MDFKVVALDLDGTILNSDKKVSENSKRVLQYLSSEEYKKSNDNKDIMVLLASGRAPYLVQPVEEALGIDCYLIGYNGSVCYSRKSEGRKTLFSRSIKNNYLQKVLKYVEENNLFLNIYSDGGFVYGIDTPSLKEKPERYSIMTGATYKFISSYSELPEGFEPAKCLIILDDDNECDQLLEKMRPLFPELSLVKSNCMNKDYKQYYVEFLEHGVNKGTSVIDFCTAKSVDRSQVVAFGDAENDIEMLSEAGFGICLQNGTEPTKKVSNLISSFTNDQDGVARELVKLFNLPEYLIQ
ncbi:hypothetical protein DICPUDRAFT_76364 [Dictyostelium purpureum]|uniref:Haloacid dehalogenase-like hydrolase n=1 Tax=Dictyostelium purpureum TaxID=5786 RepID=F0ZDE0_DICPU|nr:uncharacterized protein DICPUDRAFT_76364 [Dictyostelium purpureum]EGC38049.1 hypothetical protein DICPUDRAFT_76364 [Dictyostelium purpureum]|eukprot:XP_003285450.1 hypothetical protein DICPUDRAFT_76364 [Dictyostelium purpureum]